MKTTISVIAALAIVSAIASPVKVSSFGFDKNNATKCLQAALDSKHRDLIIDNTGSDWIVDPIILRSDKNIVLDENVVIRARHDGFHGIKDSMFTGKNVSNITISGKKNAAIINENDYFNRKVYSQSEWRHTFSLAGCTNITIKDLKLQGSGGDGFYIRDAKRKPCCNITLENLDVSKQGRQGVSLISVNGLRIRNCSFRDTRGLSPEAGIDFEPNHPYHEFTDCIIENTTFSNNHGPNALHVFGKFNATTKPVSITYRNCIFEGGNSHGIIINRGANPPKGNFSFEKCTVTNARKNSLSLDIMPDFPVVFNDLKIKHTSKYPVVSILMPKIYKQIAGTATLKNISVTAPENTQLFDAFIYPVTITAELKLENFTLNGKAVSSVPEFDKLKKLYGQAIIPAETDINTLKSPAPVKQKYKMDPKQSIGYRNKRTMVLDGRKGEEITVKLTGKGVTKRHSACSITVTDPSGKTILNKSFSNFKKQKVSFTPEMNGWYKVTTNSRSKLTVTTDHRGQGMLMGARLQLFRSRGSLFFEVPGGLDKFNILIWGNPEESVSASLIDPDGKVVKRKVKFEKPEFFTGSSKDVKESKIWQIKIESSRDDFTVLFPAPLHGVFAENPDLLLRTR